MTGKTRVGACAIVVVGCVAAAARAQDLLGVHFDNGSLFRISATNAAITPAGNVGGTLVGGLELSPDGFVYALGAGNPFLYRIHPVSLAVTPVGAVNVPFMFEGSIAFAPNGVAYAVNGGDSLNAQLFTLDVTNGNATLVGTIGGAGERDINGLAWRADGKLVALDRGSNTLLAIDPTNAASTIIAPVIAPVGGVGGMTVLGGVGYFSTAALTAGPPGGNNLWSFNLFTGAQTLVGNFPANIGGNGIGGLTVIPEPALATATTVLFALRRRRR